MMNLIPSVENSNNLEKSVPDARCLFGPERVHFRTYHHNATHRHSKFHFITPRVDKVENPEENYR